MDPKLLKHVNDSMPKFNEAIASGFHKRDFERVERIYERDLRMTFQGLEKKGVWFFGIRSVRPSEMFDVISKPSQNKPFQTNKESLYPVAVMIGFGPTRETAQMFPPAYVLLPFCDEYGDMWIRGSKYSLQMVMADRGLSVTKDDQIFVRILGYKFKVGTESYEYTQVHHETDTLMTSSIPVNLPANRFYKSSEARKPHQTKTPIPLLAWYNFAELGVTKTIEQFGECHFAIGDRDALIDMYPAKDGWNIFTGQGSSLAKGVGPYSDLGLAIAAKPIDPKRKGIIPTIGHQYIAALLYMFETFSSYVDLECLDNSDFWKIIVGYSSVKETESREHLLKQMDDHFDSIANDSLNEDGIQRFAEQRIVVNNMTELFNYIIANRTEIVKTSDKANMLHKELCSVEFTIDRLITAATRFKHEVKNTTNLTYQKVAKWIPTYFKLREIEPAAWSSNMKQEETPTDNPLADYGLGVLSQAKVFESQDRGRSSDFNPNDPANRIHASLLFTMSWQRTTKPHPDSRGFVLPCVYLANGNYLGLRDRHRVLYEATHDRLTKQEVTK